MRSIVSGTEKETCSFSELISFFDLFVCLSLLPSVFSSWSRCRLPLATFPFFSCLQITRFFSWFSFHVREDIFNDHRLRVKDRKRIEYKGINDIIICSSSCHWLWMLLFSFRRNLLLKTWNKKKPFDVRVSWSPCVKVDSIATFLWIKRLWWRYISLLIEFQTFSCLESLLSSSRLVNWKGKSCDNQQSFKVDIQVREGSVHYEKVSVSLKRKVITFFIIARISEGNILSQKWKRQ
jgi:hypothetical protein